MIEIFLPGGPAGGKILESWLLKDIQKFFFFWEIEFNYVKKFLTW